MLFRMVDEFFRVGFIFSKYHTSSCALKCKLNWPIPHFSDGSLLHFALVLLFTVRSTRGILCIVEV